MMTGDFTPPRRQGSGTTAPMIGDERGVKGWRAVLAYRLHAGPGMPGRAIIDPFPG